MGNARKRADAELEAIYAEVPDMLDCKGLCHDSCGPINLTKREYQRIDMCGVQIPAVSEVVNKPSWSCPALTSDNRCSVYDVRPLICRLYGSVDIQSLKCQHGCVPKGGFLSKEKAAELVQRTVEVGGGEMPW